MTTSATSTISATAEPRRSERHLDAGQRTDVAPPHLEDGVARFGAWMKQHPIAALGVGLAVGYVVARLVPRRA